MTDQTAERLRLSLITMQECMAMHWANESRKMNNEEMAYNESDFYNVINQNHEQ